MATKTRTAAAASNAAAAQPENKFSAAQNKALAAVVAATTAADSANQQRTSSYGMLSTQVERLLGKCGDVQTAALLTAAYAALHPTIGGKDKDADKDSAAIWLRRAQILSVTVRRFNAGAAGAAPRFNVLYVALDRKECAAHVVCLAKPTSAELKKALAKDTKALNAYVAKLFPSKSSKAPGKPEPEHKPQTAMPGKVSTGGSMAALRELVAQWRPAELEAAAAELLALADAGRKALEKAKADKKAAKPAVDAA